MHNQINHIFQCPKQLNLWPPLFNMCICHWKHGTIIHGLCLFGMWICHWKHVATNDGHPLSLYEVNPCSHITARCIQPGLLILMSPPTDWPITFSNDHHKEPQLLFWQGPKKCPLWTAATWQLMLSKLWGRSHPKSAIATLGWHISHGE